MMANSIHTGQRAQARQLVQPGCLSRRHWSEADLFRKRRWSLFAPMVALEFSSRMCESRMIHYDLAGRIMTLSQLSRSLARRGRSLGAQNAASCPPLHTPKTAHEISCFSIIFQLCGFSDFSFSHTLLFYTREIVSSAFLSS